MNHGFGAGGQGFLIARRTAVEHEPAESALGHPTLRKGGKSPGGGVSADDFEGGAEGGTAFDDLGAVGAVSPGLGDGRVSAATWISRGRPAAPSDTDLGADEPVDDQRRRGVEPGHVQHALIPGSPKV